MSTAPELKVVFFASLRETVGRSELSVHAGSFEALMSTLRTSLDDPAMEAITGENVRIAVNQTLVDNPINVRFENGDEIAFLPPVTGG